jgi:hypothetical protein
MKYKILIILLGIYFCYMQKTKYYNMFPRFPICSPRVFPIAPRFNLICFAQNPPLLTYIAGPKEKALYLLIESSIVGGELPWFQLFFVMGQSNLGLIFCHSARQGRAASKAMPCKRGDSCTHLMQRGEQCCLWTTFEVHMNPLWTFELPINKHGFQPLWTAFELHMNPLWTFKPPMNKHGFWHYPKRELVLRTRLSSIMGLQ